MRGMSKARNITDINAIIIHCADTPNGALWHAEDIDDWHRERGFNRRLDLSLTNVSRELHHIGYHYVIETTGHIVRGRALNEVGAHARGHNLDSIGICLVGRDAYTIDQWHALKTLVSGLRQRFGPHIDVLGHYELNAAKTCPGFDVPSWLANGMEIPLSHLHQPPQHLHGA